MIFIDIEIGDTSYNGLKITSASGQTADLVLIENNSNTELFSIDSSGNIVTTDTNLTFTMAAAGVITIDAGTTDHTSANILTMDMDVNSASVNGINIDLDVATALSASETVSGIKIDFTADALDDATSNLYGIYIAPSGTTGGGTIAHIAMDGYSNYGIYQNYEDNYPSLYGYYYYTKDNNPSGTIGSEMYYGQMEWNSTNASGNFEYNGHGFIIDNITYNYQGSDNTYYMRDSCSLGEFKKALYQGNGSDSGDITDRISGDLLLLQTTATCNNTNAGTPSILNNCEMIIMESVNTSTSGNVYWSSNFVRAVVSGEISANQTGRILYIADYDAYGGLGADSLVCGSGETFYPIHVDISGMTTGGTISMIKLEAPDETVLGLEIKDTKKTKINNLFNEYSSESLNDDAEITITTATAGFGFAQAGDNEEYALFCWKADGTVTLISNSGNAVNTDTDAKFCIYDAGTGIRIKNRLGSSKTVRYAINYS